MTKIDLNQIREELRRLTALVEGWSEPNGIPALERDLALAKLRELYDTLRFAAADVPVEVAAEVPESLNISLDEVMLAIAPAVEEPVEEAASEPEAAAVPEPEIAAEAPEEKVQVSTPEPEAAAVPEPIEMPEPEIAADKPEEEVPASEPEVIAVPEPLEAPQPEMPAAEPETEKPAEVPEPAKPYEPVLFGMEELTQHKRKQRVIMSLYGEAPVEVPAAKAVAVPVAEPQPAPVMPVAVEQPAAEIEPEEEYEEELEVVSVTQTAEPETGAVLGEVINRGVQTLGETFAPSRNTVSEAAHLSHIDDLRTAIGINDRFLLVRDLFDGNATACDTLIEKLNSFDDLDDCLIYLAEHYTWNPNSDGAKLLVELLERKLS